MKDSKINASTKKAAIYIRVSTDAQAEEGYSIEAQKEQLGAYCISKGIKNYEYYIDGGWSGSNIERPEIQRLIKEAKEHKISHCIVFKLDRLSRSQKDTLYLIEDVFIPNDVSFVSLNETLDTSTPMGKLMIGILSAFAQLERENIRLRTRMGMKERVKSGYWMGGGRVPFGYDYDKNLKVLVPNDDAETVRQIYKLYLDGYACQHIANLLGLKYDRLVIQILKRKSNYGIIEYNGEEYQGLHESIISKETYDMAMAEMAKRSPNYTSKSNYLLTGLVYCGKCGAKMRYQKWDKKNNRAKLICYSQQKSKSYLVKDCNCDQPKLWGDEIEDYVLDVLFKLKEKPTHAETHSFEKSALEILEKQKIDTDKKIKRLYLLYADSDDDILLETIEEQKRRLTSIMAQISNESENQKALISKDNIDDIILNLKSMWNNSTFQQKRNILKLLIDKIIITDENIDIRLKV